MGAAAQLRVHSLPKSWRPVRLRASKRLPATFAVKPAPEASARAAGLRYTSDSRPGIQRRRSGTGFTYLTPDGRIVRDRSDLQRIKALVIPPAWNDVWICPDRARASPGHRSGRARPEAVSLSPALARGTRRDQVPPHDRVRAGAAGDPAADRRRPQARRLPKQKVLAPVVQLLEKTLIRVGNDEYARTEPLLRPDHDERRPRGVNGGRVRSRSAARAASSTKSISTTAGSLGS